MTAEPNFLIAGCVATGTSFLSHSMQHHPQIYLPKIMRPECGFFYKSWEYEKGLEYYRQKWFSDVKGELAIGERSSLYISGTFNQVAERIYRHYPKMKLIFCLRNPTERAFANYRFTAMTGFESLNFDDAMRLEQKRTEQAKGWRDEIRPHANLARGLYFEQLQPFFERFAAEQILCIKSERMSKAPQQTFAEVFRFLGVNEHFEPPKQENFSAPNVKSARLQRMWRLVLGNRLDEITENVRVGDREGFLASIVGLNLTAQKQQMSERQRQFLNEYYAEDKSKLAKLLNWDLQDWN